MNPFVYWLLAPIVSAALGYLLWQMVKLRAEVARRLADRQALAEIFSGEGKRSIEGAKTDRRVARALKDRTQLAINTPILFRTIDRGYLQAMTACALLILAIAALCMSFVHPALGIFAIAAAGGPWFAPLHALAVRRVRADLAALAFSLLLWYKDDEEICENVNLMSTRFEALLDYVKKDLLHVVR